MLTQTRLKEVLEYNPDSGVFTWKGVHKIPGKRKQGRIAGTVNSDGYTVIYVDNRQYRAARLAWMYMTGRFPNPTVDHKNRNRTDDRFGNLREATKQQQRINQKKYRNNGLPKSIYWVRNKYQVDIVRRGKKHYFGRFDDLQDAINARNKGLHLLEGAIS